MPQPINFKEIFEQLKEGVLTLAKTTAKNYVNEAKQDAQNMLDEMKSDLERWTTLLANKQLTTKEFEYLVNSEKDSFKMAALEQAGLAEIRIDQFKNSVLNLIADTVFHLIPL